MERQKQQTELSHSANNTNTNVFDDFFGSSSGPKLPPKPTSQPSAPAPALPAKPTSHPQPPPTTHHQQQTSLPPLPSSHPTLPQQTHQQQQQQQSHFDFMNSFDAFSIQGNGQTNTNSFSQQTQPPKQQQQQQQVHNNLSDPFDLSFKPTQQQNEQQGGVGLAPPPPSGRSRNKPQQPTNLLDM